MAHNVKWEIFGGSISMISKTAYSNILCSMYMDTWIKIALFYF